MMLPAELHLTDAEARQWAEAQLNFQREFNVEIPAKWQAGLALMGVTFGTFRPKLGQLGQRVRAQRQAAAEAASPFNVPGAPNMPPTHQQPGERPRGNGELRPDGVVSSGGQTIIMTGRVPDGGKLDFGTE